MCKLKQIHLYNNNYYYVHTYVHIYVFDRLLGKQLFMKCSRKLKKIKNSCSGIDAFKIAVSVCFQLMPSYLARLSEGKVAWAQFQA